MVTSELMCMLCSTRPVQSLALALHPRWDCGSWPKVRTPLQGTIGETVHRYLSEHCLRTRASPSLTPQVRGSTRFINTENQAPGPQNARGNAHQTQVLEPDTKEVLPRNTREQGRFQSLSDPATPFLAAWSKKPMLASLEQASSKIALFQEAADWHFPMARKHCLALHLYENRGARQVWSTGGTLVARPDCRTTHDPFSTDKQIRNEKDPAVALQKMPVC